MPKILLYAFLAIASLAAQCPAATKPNIVFILSDDQGYGDLGRHKNPILQTPNLDKLHDQSVRFTDFCVSSSCSPTRASLLSGIYNLRAGVTHTIAPRCNLNPRLTILPQYLKAAGYSTACIGKWHLGEGEGLNPADRGFDFVTGNETHFPEGPNGRYREDILFDEAMDFINRSAGRPFFCYLATWSPHAPLIVADKYSEPYKGKVDDQTAKFYGMIANLDENVGRLLRFLEKKGLDRDTIVVFMNDNGSTFGVDTWNAYMRGSKCTVWPGGHRAISFWRWPGKWQPRDESALTAHVDVLPTLVELAGGQLPGKEHLDGRSLLGLLEGKEDPWFAQRHVFQHNARWASGKAQEHKDVMAAVRWKEYLLVRSRPCKDAEACTEKGASQCVALRDVENGETKGTYTTNAQFVWGVTPGEGWALYNVHDDPGCQNNLAQKEAPLAAELQASYDQWWDSIYPEMIAAGGDAPLSEAAKVSWGRAIKKP